MTGCNSEHFEEKAFIHSQNKLFSPKKATTKPGASCISCRPVIRKVLSLGYPRQPAMKNLVPDVLKRIQAELSVPHPVKDTNVRVKLAQQFPSVA